MGKTLSSSPAWVKASWISWKNSGSRDGATVATAWAQSGERQSGHGAGDARSAYRCRFSVLMALSAPRMGVASAGWAEAFWFTRGRERDTATPGEAEGLLRRRRAIGGPAPG